MRKAPGKRPAHEVERKTIQRSCSACQRHPSASVQGVYWPNLEQISRRGSDSIKYLIDSIGVPKGARISAKNQLLRNEVGHFFLRSFPYVFGMSVPPTGTSRGQLRPDSTLGTRIAAISRFAAVTPRFAAVTPRLATGRFGGGMEPLSNVRYVR